MAAAAIKGRAAVEVLVDERGTVRILEGGKVRKIRADSKRGPELWSEEVDFVLTQAESVLGFRGSTGAVISIIEHGGAGGSLQHDDVMLRRIGCIEGSKVPVRRAKELIARWRTLPHQHQRVLAAHHLLTLRLDDGARGGSAHKIVTRCGRLSGVVVMHWLESRGTDWAGVRQKLDEKVQGELEQKPALLHREELAHQAARRALPAATISRPELRLPRYKADVDAHEAELDRRAQADAVRARRRFQCMARYQLEWLASGRLKALRDLRAEVGRLLSRQSDVADVGTEEADLNTLVRLCEKGDPPSELTAAAETAVREAYKAWEQTGRRAAEAWLEA